MSEKTYNGWKNRETWVVALWIDGTEISQKFWDDKARDALNLHSKVTNFVEDQEAAVVYLSDDLRITIETASPIYGNNVYADLLNGALENVDWHEIAEHLIEGLK